MPKTFNKPKSDHHNFNMNKLMILQNQKGEKTAVIRAKRAYTGKNKDVFMMENINADIFAKDGTLTNIVAQSGEYNTTTKLLTLVGNVVVNRAFDKQFLYTNLLLYDSKQRRINCPEKIRLKGEDIIIDGGSLDYDIATNHYLIDDKVLCIINDFDSP